jgi:hypothetical protein
VNIDPREIPNIRDADADGSCDLEFLNFWSEHVCTIDQPGNNHLGYVGFRGLAAYSLINNGVMDIIVNTFLN